MEESRHSETKRWRKCLGTRCPDCFAFSMSVKKEFTVFSSARNMNFSNEQNLASESSFVTSDVDYIASNCRITDEG
jgi:hypothetical protein